MASKHRMLWLFLKTERLHFQIIYFFQKVWFGFSRSVQYHRASNLKIKNKKKGKAERKRAKEAPYLWQSEDSPSSSTWTGRLSCHHHHTPPRCCQNPSPGRARSCRCCCSSRHCVPRWTRWGTAGSSCRQVRRGAGGSAGPRQGRGSALRSSPGAAGAGSAGGALGWIPSLLPARLDAS